MNLTIADLADLPLAAAAFDSAGTLIAKTPEWRGPAPGAVSFPVHGNRLVAMGADAAGSGCEPVLDRLLAGMAGAAAVSAGRAAARIDMLAASLRLIAGRTAASSGDSGDAIELATAGIAVRTGLHVVVEPGPSWRLEEPAVAALVLVQLAANAERHARVGAITLSQTEHAFHVSWRGRPESVAVSTSRHRGRRQGWGLGFARIAADTLGGTVYPPSATPDGSVDTTFELGLRRLALPLALIREGRVVRATRAWDEETGYPPGHAVGAGSRLTATLGDALASPGRVAGGAGLWGRAVEAGVWMTIPPDGIVDRARDVIDGIAHEQALWQGVPEPDRSRVYALANLLGAMLGEPLPRVPAAAWNRRFGELCAGFGLNLPVPQLRGIGAVDPRIAAYLLAEYGDHIEAVGEQLRLRIRPDRLDDPVVRSLKPVAAVISLT